MGREVPTQAPSSLFVSVIPPLSCTRTLWAWGATMRKRARRSELTWGYSLPPWLEDAGLKSSTACSDWAGGVWGGVACANAIWPASRDSNTKPIDATLMTVLLGPETEVGPTDTRGWGS